MTANRKTIMKIEGLYDVCEQTEEYKRLYHWPDEKIEKFIRDAYAILVSSEE